MRQPKWANIEYDKIDLQNIKYYSAPTKKTKLKSLDEVDPEILKTLNKLGISIEEQKKLTGVIFFFSNICNCYSMGLIRSITF